MNTSEFEHQYQLAVEEVLNQLQTVILLMPELEQEVVSTGQSLRSLSFSIEELMARHRIQQVNSLSSK